jgi:hypothetical protein
MALFKLDYGDLVRPVFRILPQKGWAQCSNWTTEFLVVYGPKHEAEQSIFDTSPYVLPVNSTTPDHWDCKGFFLPSDRVLVSAALPGPLAIKFWNGRRFWVRNPDAKTYKCSWNNGTYQPSQINWAIPNFNLRSDPEPRVWTLKAGRISGSTRPPMRLASSQPI